MSSRDLQAHKDLYMIVGYQGVGLPLILCHYYPFEDATKGYFQMKDHGTMIRIQLIRLVYQDVGMPEFILVAEHKI